VIGLLLKPFPVSEFLAWIDGVTRETALLRAQ
jgi:hypothetical protein